MDFATAKSVIQNSPDLQALDDASRSALFWIGNPIWLSQGAVLYEQGQDFDNTFCLLVSGSLAAVISGQEPKVIEPGSFVGEVAYFSPRLERGATVQVTSEQAELLQFSMSPGDLRQEFPDLHSALGVRAWERVVEDGNVAPGM